MEKYLLNKKSLSRKPLQRLAPAGATTRGADASKTACKKAVYEKREIFQSLKHINPQKISRRVYSGMPQYSHVFRFLKKAHSADSRLLQQKSRSEEDNLCELFNNINRNTKNFYDVE